MKRMLKTATRTPPRITTTPEASNIVLSLLDDDVMDGAMVSPNSGAIFFGIFNNESDTKDGIFQLIKSLLQYNERSNINVWWSYNLETRKIIESCVIEMSLNTLEQNTFIFQ